MIDMMIFRTKNKAINMLKIINISSINESFGLNWISDINCKVGMVIGLFHHYPERFV